MHGALGDAEAGRRRADGAPGFDDVCRQITGAFLYRAMHSHHSPSAAGRRAFPAPCICARPGGYEPRPGPNATENSFAKAVKCGILPVETERPGDFPARKEKTCARHCMGF